MSDDAPPTSAGEPQLDKPFAAQVSGDTVAAQMSGSAGTAIDDAEDLRGFHFRRLLRKRSTQIASEVLVLGAAILGAIFGGLLVGALAAIAVALLIVLVLFVIADSASEEAFFELYAEQRGLEREKEGSLPPLTPLLRKGDERKAEEVMHGPLGHGVEGTLALYTYTDVYHDRNGRQETDYRFTVSITELPESVELVPELYCNRKSGFRFLEGIEDVFRTKQRVHLESEALEEHYEIFTSKGQDQNWLRQLFSPTFIVWLTDSAPEKFAFELDSGTLCCNVKGHQKDAEHLDAMREVATAIADRIREEVGESASAR